MFLHICLLLLSSKVWNQNGRNPYITYEYTVMRDPLAPVSQPPIYTGSDRGSSHHGSMEIESVLPHNESAYDKAVPETERNQLRTQGVEPGAVERQQPGQETNEVYEETAAIDCEQDASTSPQFPGRYWSHL